MIVMTDSATTTKSTLAQASAVRTAMMMRTAGMVRPALGGWGVVCVFTPVPVQLDAPDLNRALVRFLARPFALATIAMNALSPMSAVPFPLVHWASALNTAHHPG